MKIYSTNTKDFCWHNTRTERGKQLSGRLGRDPETKLWLLERSDGDHEMKIFDRLSKLY